MADGTFATWAGTPCFAAKFTRARGWQSSVSEVEIPARAAGAGRSLNMSSPAGGTITRRPAAPAASPPSGDFSGPAPSIDAIPHEGFLVLSDVVNGEQFSVTIGPLFVARAEAIRTPDASPISRVRLYLVDERYFWPRGHMSRWSFNRRRGDGTIAADSVKPDLAPFTRAEIAAEVAQSLFRSPTLAATPPEWATDATAVEFAPFAPAVTALSALVTEAGLEEPCLRLDNTIGLHKAGEGRVGYARDGRGANAQDFPPRFRLYKDGAGQGAVTENGYPEDYVIVAGGVRIATVALDFWEPVLVLNGTDVVPLTESRVRFLTDQRYGLDWLHRFILQPNAYQSVVGISSNVLDVFRTQPYRLFRCPGAVVPIRTAQDPRAGNSPSGVSKDFGIVYEPGPNAHLLPMLPRAETIAGRRQPILVEASTFTTEHQALQGGASEAQLRLVAVQRAIAVLRSTPPGIQKLKDTLGNGTLVTDAPLTIEDIFAGNEIRATGRGVSFEELAQALKRAREIEGYRGAPGGDVFADQLQALTLEQLEAEESAYNTPGRSEMFEIAQDIIALEKQLREEAGLLDTGDDNFAQRLLNEPGVREAFLGKISAKLAKIEAERRATQERERVGGADANGAAASMVVLKNVARSSVKFKMFNEDQGVVEIDQMAVHVEIDPEAFKPGDMPPARPSSPAHARAIPCPVRVTFGATMRPRTDSPWTPETTARPRTGDPPQRIDRKPGESLGDYQRRVREETAKRNDAVTPRPGETPQEFIDRQAHDCPTEPDVIPEVLTDTEAPYSAAFRRTGRGTGVRVPVKSVPKGLGVTLNEPDFVELVPIEGQGNRADLDEQAERLALTRFLVADQVKTVRTTIAHPWPVQCDGHVSSVEIAMRFKDGAPCGFETIVTSGGSAPAAKIKPRARTGGGAKREGLSA